MSESKIFAQMAMVMSEVDAIGKDKTNQQQNFKYRGIDQVYNALNPLLAKHKIFTMPKVLNSEREERTNKNGTVLFYSRITMEYTFYTIDGSSVSCSVIGEGMDSGDKATNKAMAIAHKYALLQTFCIPTEDMPDPDAESHELQPNKQSKNNNNKQEDEKKAKYTTLVAQTMKHFKMAQKDAQNLLNTAGVKYEIDSVNSALNDFNSLVAHMENIIRCEA